MNKEKQFLLLDVDGVLLESNGYRLSCLSAASHFIHCFGQPNITVENVVWETYEASGITAEWDMVPLILLSFLDIYYTDSGETPSPDCFNGGCRTICYNNQNEFTERLLRYIPKFREMVIPHTSVFFGIRDALLGGSDALPKLRGTELLKKMLTDTLNPRTCPFFAYLMTLLLGSETFRSFYGIEPPLDTPSLLETTDRKLISEENRVLLPALPANGIYPVIMTYRPTLLPRTENSGNMDSAYFVNTPEGECALRLLGWDDGRMPVIGAGSLCWIEEKYQLMRETYVKPHPMHALSAMLYALCGSETEALELARVLCGDEPHTNVRRVYELLPRSTPLRLSVFEDSVTGISSCLNAAEVLRKHGYSVRTDLNGIKTTPKKNERLLESGAKLYDNFNEAFDACVNLKG